MSTFVTNTSSGPSPSTTVRPHTVPVIPRRRKVSELDDIEEEPIRPTKRSKQSHGPEQASALLRQLEIMLTSLQINQRLAKMSLTRAGKKRVRSGGKGIEVSCYLSFHIRPPHVLAAAEAVRQVSA